MSRIQCPRCLRPQTHCLCPLIPSLDSRTRVLLLQHPSEVNHALNTARLAALGLKNAELIVGEVFEDLPALLNQPGYQARLLFPGEDAQTLQGYGADDQPLLLVVPLLAMLSLSYAYGRVLTVQKAFAASALMSLEYDISSHRPLREAKRIYLSVTYSDHWLLGAAGSFKQMPVLHYLLNIDFFMLAENLPKVGITNVVAEKERRNATRVGYQGYPALVDRPYYRIYLLGDYGFIVIKEPAPIKALRW